MLCKSKETVIPKPSGNSWKNYLSKTLQKALMFFNLFPLTSNLVCVVSE